MPLLIYPTINLILLGIQRFNRNAERNRILVKLAISLIFIKFSIFLY